ncbi:TPA: hypothetical protein ACGOVD_000305 [Streptococcus suis]
MRIDRLVAFLVLSVMIGQNVLTASLTAWAEGVGSSSSVETREPVLTNSDSEASNTEPLPVEESSTSSTEPATEAETLTGLSQEGVKETTSNLPSYLLVILPLDADGDILRSSYQQGYNQVALIGKDKSFYRVYRNGVIAFLIMYCKDV